MINFKRKFFMCVLTLCALLPAVFLAGCGQGFCLASTKEAKSCFIGEELEKGFCVEIEFMNNDNNVFLLEDFTYEMDGQTYEISGFVQKTRYVGSQLNGQISMKEYYILSDSFNAGKAGVVKVIVKGEISKLFYKGTEITKTKI